ncbi:MAG TPA: helix-turn-helix domain-containing protein [Hanamia sp.]
MELQNKRILTIDEASSYLGYKKSYVLQMTSLGVLPFSKPHKKIYFEREKLEDWMLSNPNEPQKESKKTKVTHG